MTVATSSAYSSRSGLSKAMFMFITIIVFCNKLVAGFEFPGSGKQYNPMAPSPRISESFSNPEIWKKSLIRSDEDPSQLLNDCAKLANDNEANMFRVGNGVCYYSSYMVSLRQLSFSTRSDDVLYIQSSCGDPVVKTVDVLPSYYSIDVSWTASNPCDFDTEFSVTWSDNNIVTKDMNYVINDLSPDTLYSISVAPVDFTGYEFSDPVFKEISTQEFNELGFPEFSPEFSSDLLDSHTGMMLATNITIRIIDEDEKIVSGSDVVNDPQTPEPCYCEESASITNLESRRVGDNVFMSWTSATQCNEPAKYLIEWDKGIDVVESINMYTIKDSPCGDINMHVSPMDQGGNIVGATVSTTNTDYNKDLPIGLNISATGEMNKVRVQWSFDIGCNVISGYSIKLISEFDEVIEAEVGRKRTSLLMGGLKCGTRYSATVNAKNNDGEKIGDTLSTEFRTEISELQLTSAEMVTDQTSVLGELKTNCVGNYNVRIGMMSESDSQIQMSKGNSTSNYIPFEFSNLESNTRYTFVAEAFNDAGVLTSTITNVIRTQTKIPRVTNLDVLSAVDSVTVEFLADLDVPNFYMAIQEVGKAFGFRRNLIVQRNEFGKYSVTLRNLSCHLLFEAVINFDLAGRIPVTEIFQIASIPKAPEIEVSYFFDQMDISWNSIRSCKCLDRIINFKLSYGGPDEDPIVVVLDPTTTVHQIKRTECSLIKIELDVQLEDFGPVNIVSSAILTRQLPVCNTDDYTSHCSGCFHLPLPVFRLKYYQAQQYCLARNETLLEPMTDVDLTNFRAYMQSLIDNGSWGARTRVWVNMFGFDFHGFMWLNRGIPASRDPSLWMNMPPPMPAGNRRGVYFDAGKYDILNVNVVAPVGCFRFIV